MANYNISNQAKEDLIRIYQYGLNKFGESQADKYFNSLFEYFDTITENPYSFPSVDFIKKGYRRCSCGTDSIYYKINNEVIEIMTIIGRQEFNITDK